MNWNLPLDSGPVVQRMLDEAYRLPAALPLFALALLVVGIGWWLGRWLSQRPVLDRVAQSNPFLRDLTRTTVRWIVITLGVLVALGS